MLRRSLKRRVSQMLMLGGIWLALCSQIPWASAEDRQATPEDHAVWPPTTEDNIQEHLRALERVLEVQEKALGARHPLCVELRLKLAAAYHEAGDHAQALQAYEEALHQLEASVGPGHPDVRALIPRVVEEYALLGELPAGKGASPEDVAIFNAVLKQQQENLGRHHPQVRRLQDYTGGKHASRAEAEGAEQAYRQMVDNETQGRGATVENALMKLSIAETLWHQGELDRASVVTQEAYQTLLKRLGPVHPKTVQALRQMVLILFDQGQKRPAAALSATLYAAEDALMESVLAVTSEHDRLQYLAQHNPYAVPSALGDHQRLALAAVRYKSLVLDSMLEDVRRAGVGQDPYLDGLLQERREIKEALVGYYFQSSADADDPDGRAQRAAMADLRLKLETIERELAHYVSGLGQVRQALHMTPAAIQARLPLDTVLVEYIVYPHYLGQDQWESRYAAMVLAPQRAMQWIPLGPAGAMDDVIRRCQQVIEDDAVGNAQMKESLQALYARIWRPVGETLGPEVKSIVLSPDGMLNFVAFAALLTEDDHFLVERYQLRYVGSGRDLLSPVRPSGNSTICIFSNPEYHPDNFWAKMLARLPGSLEEGRRIEALAKRHHFFVHLFTGPEASEEHLRAVRSPRILHLATHGYLLKEAPRLPITLMKDEARHWSIGPHNGKRDPMNQGGLALAAGPAQYNQDGSLSRPTVNDGIMTAEEIGLLSLEGTWLAVVPACYTGLGSVEKVEGPLGVRRGFMLAGVAHLVTALWEVADRQTTPELMEDFYRKIFEGMDPVAAMTLTQRHWLRYLRHTGGLRKAVKEAGEWILISRDNHP